MKKKKPAQPKKKTNLHYSENKSRHPDQILRVGGRVEGSLFFLFCFLLPAQLGKHFFLSFSYLSGIRIDYLAPTLYITDILAIALIGVNIKTVILFFKTKFFLVLFSLFLFSGFFALSKPLFLYQLIKYIEVISLFAVFKERFFFHKKIIITGLACATFLQIPLVVSQFVVKHSLQGWWYFLGERYFTLSTPGIAKAALQGTEILRPYGSFSHPNSMAGFFLLIYIFFLVRKDITNIFLKYVVLSFSTLIVFLSFSKNAILVYLIINALYLFREKQSCRICKVAKITVPIVLAFIFLSAQTDILSLQKRVTLIVQSLTIFFQHPLTGVGPGNYLLAQSEFPIKYPYFFLQPVHNIFLLFMTENGLIVTGFIVWRLISFLRRNAKTAGSFLFLLAILLTGMNDHYWLTLQQNILLSGVLLGIMVYNKYGETS